MRAYITVITKSYLAYAKVLMDRLRLLDPDVEQYVFLADNIDGCFDPALLPFHVVVPEEYVDPIDLRQMAFQYTAFELSTALKAFAHRYMLRNTSCTHWAFFDSDIYPVSSCVPVLEQSEDQTSASVFMTPHVLKPCPMSLMWLETLFLRFGVYNGGWLAIRRSADAEEFIEWYVARLRTHGFNEYKQTFVDQLWLNLAPSYLNGIGMANHPGLNIGYWNLHERNMTEKADGAFDVNGTQVVFVHFSGWDANNPTIVTKHWPQIESSPAWRKIAADYSSALLSAGLQNSRSWPYTWQHYSDGQVIGSADRRRFADQMHDGKWPATDDPFNCADRLSKPSHGTGRLAGAGMLGGAYRSVRRLLKPAE